MATFNWKMSTVAVVARRAAYEGLTGKGDCLDMKK
jgi:hypothetical protein